MNSQIRWRYDADNVAFQTRVGERIGGLIRVRARSGWALYGPYLDMPAGRCFVRIRLAQPARGTVRFEIAADWGRTTLACEKVNLRSAGTVLELSIALSEPATALEVRLLCRGEVSLDIAGIEIDLERDISEAPLQPDRPVGYETGKTYADKIASGFFDRYLSGPVVMEVGYKGYDGGTVPVVPQAIGVDVDYPGYDGETFPFAGESFDAIYSSHCFEHVGPWKAVLRDWYRLLRPGGFLIIIVPLQVLFERKRYLPSRFNTDHKRYYTARSLLGEIEEALEENSYRIRHLVENDKDFDYRPAPTEGSSGCYEIELVVEKITPPYWHPDDGSVRAYPAGEFTTPLSRTEPWYLDLDLSEVRLLLWGPYVGLGASRYVAEFHFDPLDLPADIPAPAMVFDVAEANEPVARVEVKGEDARAMLRAGKLVLPFDNDRTGAIFEFRIFAAREYVAAKPRFRGLNLVYSRLPRPLSSAAATASEPIVT